MVNPDTIKELNQAMRSSPAGFLVVDSGSPRFAVLPYEAYQRLVQTSTHAPVKKKKLLVTGGAGYIGSQTVRLLQKQQEYEIIILDNLSTGRREAVRDSELIVADLSDQASLEKIFSEFKIDAVIHFAASVEVEESLIDPAKYFQNNVVNGLNLLDAMVEHGVSKIVFSSSAAVYGQPDAVPISEIATMHPTNPYGESKLIFEKILKWYGQSYGIHSVSLRYFNAAGAWPEEALGSNNLLSDTHLITRVLNVAAGKTPEIEVYGQDYQTPDGTCIRDYVHVLDLADAHIHALKKLETTNGAYVYNVGSGIGYSVMEIIDQAMEITGRMIPIKLQGRRAGDPAKLVADSSAIGRELGWSATHDLRSIMRSAWQWHNMV